MYPFPKGRVIIQPQARQCMQKLHISEDEVLTTINEWESGDVSATDPLTANTLAAYPETANEIPALYESELTFPERNQVMSVTYSTSMKQQRGKTVVYATVHWVSVHPPLNFHSENDEPVKADWLEPKQYQTN